MEYSAENMKKLKEDFENKPVILGDDNLSYLLVRQEGGKQKRIPCVYVSDASHGYRFVKRQESKLFQRYNEKLGILEPETFEYVSDEYFGYRVVQRQKNAPFQLYIAKNGKFVGNFEYLTTMQNGPAVAKKIGEDDYFFIDENGKSSKYYPYAEGYSYGKALYITKNGKFGFRDRKGKLGRITFDQADSYSDGFALVRFNGDPVIFRFLNLAGNLEGLYGYATGYCNGFATVIEQGKTQKMQRDLLGNLTEGRTELGKKVFEYLSGDVTLEDLVCDPNFSYDKKFERYATMVENYRLQQRQIDSEIKGESFNEEKEEAEMKARLESCFKNYSKKDNSKVEKGSKLEFNR